VLGLLANFTVGWELAGEVSCSVISGSSKEASNQCAILIKFNKENEKVLKKYMGINKI
jgi:hypothetical protein